eukprot:13302196-Alexandrium_andersonii.AAC.1
MLRARSAEVDYECRRKSSQESGVLGSFASLGGRAVWVVLLRLLFWAASAPATRRRATPFSPPPLVH